MPTEINLTSPEFKRNPFPTLARMRELGPVIQVRFPIFGRVWMATTYEAVDDLLRRHQEFVQNPTTAGNPWMTRLVRWLPSGLKPLATNLLLQDEPNHRRLRRLVDQAFLKHSIERLRPRICQLADELIDRMIDQARSGSRSVDLLEHFARPLPLAIICELLGLPPEDRSQFTRWAGQFSTASSPTGIVWGLLTGANSLMRYLRAEFRRQAEHPRDGLIAALVEAEETGDKLSEDELVAMVFLLLAAGHETTLHQIALSVVSLLEHPDQLHRLRSEGSLGEAAVEELLRFVSFAQVSKPRYARRDLRFGGQSIRQGQMIFGCLASANADPAMFPNPEKLDFTRPVRRNLAFGTGIHVCLGAPLARMEIGIALERLLTRCPNLRIATPTNRLPFSSRPGTRALIQLPMTGFVE